MCVRVSACELAEVCTSTPGDACDVPTSCVRVSEGTSDFRRSESFGWSDEEEEGSWEVEETVDKSAAGLGAAVDVAVVDTEEDVDKARDKEEVEDGLGAAREERTAEEEEDLETGDLGAEEEEDVILLSE